MVSLYMYPKITLVNSQEFRTLDLQIKGRHLKKKQKKNMVYLGFFLFCILHRNPCITTFLFYVYYMYQYIAITLSSTRRSKCRLFPIL